MLTYAIVIMLQNFHWEQHNSENYTWNWKGWRLRWAIKMSKWEEETCKSKKNVNNQSTIVEFSVTTKTHSFISDWKLISLLETPKTILRAQVLNV